MSENWKTRTCLYIPRKGKIEALMVARRKAEYLVEAVGKKLGDVIRIVESEAFNILPYSGIQSKIRSSDAESFDCFRTIKKSYSMLVRFKIVDK